jgi:hypothetical protein
MALTYPETHVATKTRQPLVDDDDERLEPAHVLPLGPHLNPNR